MSSEIAAAPAVLRQTAGALRSTAAGVTGDLTGTYHCAAPDRSANPDWDVTIALDALVAALDAALHRTAGDLHAAAARLEQAAIEYEQADERAVARLRW
jgi:hypothetical protein